MELTDLSMEVTLDILPHVFPRDLSLELQLTPQQILLICVRTTLSFHTTFTLTAVIEQIRHRKWSQGEVPRNGFIFLLVVRLKLICCNTFSRSEENNINPNIFRDFKYKTCLI